MALDVSVAGESAGFTTAFVSDLFGVECVDCVSLDATTDDARKDLGLGVRVHPEILDAFRPPHSYKLISVLTRSAGWRTLFQKFFKLESLLADDGYLVFSIVTDIRAATASAANADKAIEEFTRRFGHARLSLKRLRSELSFSPFLPIALVPLATPKSSGKSAAWVVAVKDPAFVSFRNEAPEVLSNIVSGNWAAIARQVAPDAKATPLLLALKDRLAPYASRFGEAADKLNALGRKAEAEQTQFVANFLGYDSPNATAGLIAALRVEGDLNRARQVLADSSAKLQKSEPLKREALLLHLADGGKTYSSLAKLAPQALNFVRNVDGLSAALLTSDWTAAALALSPILQADFDSAKEFRPLLAGFAPIFANQSKVQVRAGDAGGGTACAFVAWALQPDNLTFAAEAIARFRVDKLMPLAEAVLGDARRRFPDHPSILLHGALVSAALGNGAEATRELLAYTQSYANFGASQRRSIMAVLRSFVRECQSAGIENDSAHPLLVPEIFDAYRRDLAVNTAKWFEAPFAEIFEEEANQRRKLRVSARANTQGTPLGRSPRVLFITSGNWAFLLNLFRHMEEIHSDIQFRTFDFSVIEEAIAKEHAHELYAPSRFGLDAAAVWQRIYEADQTFSELVDWADLIVCEWSTAHAVWLSRFLPPHKKLVVRLHSYEAFTQWPFFLNYGGVDGFIFVADHIRRFSDLQFRWSRFPLQTELLPNFNFLKRFELPKAPVARRTLAMVGYSNLNKDPLMAAQALALLRKQDPKWRLLLVGHRWDPSKLRGRELEYFLQFEAFVDDNNLSDAIVYRDFTRDIPVVMREVGFILSCSWREGTHESILEGMASGAIPVVRRWPMVHEFGAPETVYPDLDYFDTADEAARTILKYADDASFERKSDESIRYAMERFDIDAVFPRFEKLITEFVQAP